MKNFREKSNYRASAVFYDKDKNNKVILSGEGISCIGEASNICYMTKDMFIDFMNDNVNVNTDLVKYEKAKGAICKCDFRFTFVITLADEAKHKTKNIELTKADLFSYCYIHNAKCVIDNNIAIITTCYYNHLYALNSANKKSKNGFFDNISMYGHVEECKVVAYNHENHIEQLKGFNGKYKDVVKYMQNWYDLRGFNKAKVTDRKTLVNFR